MFTPPDKQELVPVPDVLHLAVTKAAQLLAADGFQAAGAEKDGLVIQQIPSPGTRCLPGQQVVLAVADPHGGRGADTSLCPDFTGMSNRQIGSLAARLGIPVIIKGVGYAVRQSLGPGGALDGRPITIRMEKPWR